MKLIAALSVCLFVAGISNGQTAKTAPKGTAGNQAAVKVKGNNISGTIKNAHNKPMKDVEAFVYKADSTIIASGNTDAEGKFSTNSVPEGSYFVKVIYPPARKVTLIYGITVKKGNIELNLKADAPDADTMIAYDVVMPKQIKKDGNKK